MGKEGFGAHLSDKSLIALLTILLLRQGVISKFSYLAFHHLISPIGSSLKIGILLFSEEHLLIMG